MNQTIEVANVRIGSFATGSSRQQVRRGPLCPIATDFCGTAKYRDVPRRDMRGNLHLISAPRIPLELSARNSGAEFLIFAPRGRTRKQWSRHCTYGAITCRTYSGAMTMSLKQPPRVGF